MSEFLEEQGDDIHFEFQEDDLLACARAHSTIPSPPPEFDHLDIDSDDLS